MEEKARPNHQPVAVVLRTLRVSEHESLALKLWQGSTSRWMARVARRQLGVWVSIDAATGQQQRRCPDLS